jgi:hypothetical protein
MEQEINIWIFNIGTNYDWKRDNTVNTSTECGRDDRGVRSLSPCKAKNFPFFTSSIPVLRPTASYPVYARDKGAGCKAQNTPPTSVKDKITVICTSTPHMPSWHSA